MTAPTNDETIAQFMNDWVVDEQPDSEVDPQAAHIVHAVERAVAGLLEVHATTGIDLTRWPAMLTLVTLVYPNIVLEGTSDQNAVHYVLSPAGETGRYWLDGDTSKPCNPDAWGAYPTEYSPNLGTTR